MFIEAMNKYDVTRFGLENFEAKIATVEVNVRLKTIIRIFVIILDQFLNKKLY